MRIYVGNLPFAVDSEQLRLTFAEYGEIESAEVIFDYTGRSRGIAFVRMASNSDALDAIESLNGTMLDGRRIQVSEALPQRYKSQKPATQPFDRQQRSDSWYGGRSW